MQSEKLKTVVWLQTGFLGDIILTSAAFRWIKGRWPHIEQKLITTPLGAKALKDHPDLDEILIFDKRKESLWKVIRTFRRSLKACRGEATVLLQAHRSARSSLLAKGLGLHTVTYQESSLSFLADKTLPRIAMLHETQRILLLLEALGISRWEFRGARPFLPMDTANELGARIDDWAQGLPLVAIAPGSVWATKRWPPENFYKVVQGLLGQTSFKVLVVGSQEEQEAAKVVAMAGEQFPNRVWNLAGKTSLDDLRAIYPRVKLLLCNDSSPLHYASAFQVKSLAIFGSTVPALGFGPLAGGSHVVEYPLPCRPCSDHGPQVCPLGHFSCMRQIEPDRLLSLVLAHSDDKDISPVGLLN